MKRSQGIKENPKSFYSYIRSKSKTKDRVGPLSDANGNVISDDGIMSEMLNDYFSSVFTDESAYPAVPTIQDIFKADQSKLLLDLHITSDMVLNRLKHLKLSKAPGVDKLVPKSIISTILIETSEQICLQLSMIFNESISSGIVPRDWKQANVTAIFKKGLKSLPCNYRPVSLTSHICKILEAETRDVIVKHLDDFRLIRPTESQHGFVKSKSCLTNLPEYLNRLCDYVDKDKPVDGIYLDFQKAFDKSTTT